MEQTKPAEQTSLIIRVIACFWLLMKAISYKLWLKERNYPLVPFVDMPAAVHVLLFCVFVVLSLWLILRPQRHVVTALIITELITLTGDQNRLQPWHYQYLFTLFAIAANWRNKAKAIQAIALITAATYLFSGLSKINAGFLDSVWSLHILKRFLHVPGYIIHHRMVRWAGLVMPLIEISGAIGLLFPKTMKPAAWLLITMHVFIIAFLSPLGINYNVVVIPWNVQMIWVLHFLFLKNKILLRPTAAKSAANYVIAFCWIVLPIAGLLGYWDKFLSSGMYSGRGKLMQYYFAERKQIPPELKLYAFMSRSDSSARIIVTDWCMRELNVAAVAEPRVYKSITQQLNERYKNQGVHFELGVTKY